MTDKKEILINLLQNNLEKNLNNLELRNTNEINELTKLKNDMKIIENINKIINILNENNILEEVNKNFKEEKIDYEYYSNVTEPNINNISSKLNQKLSKQISNTNNNKTNIKNKFNLKSKPIRSATKIKTERNHRPNLSISLNNNIINNEKNNISNKKEKNSQFSRNNVNLNNVKIIV